MLRPNRGSVQARNADGKGRRLTLQSKLSHLEHAGTCMSKSYNIERTLEVIETVIRISDRSAGYKFYFNHNP